MNATPLNAQCKTCGAPLGYDILKQSYACKACGYNADFEEERARWQNWRSMQDQQRKAAGTAPESKCRCPGCGAVVLIPEGEASQSCDFCQSKLIREEFVESEDYPEMVIPFVLTKEEALQRMLKFVEDRKDKKLSSQVQSSLKKFDGYYLPYEFVRGPLHGRVTRDQTDRVYRCGGFLEGCAVSASVQMDNEVLDAMEPFDWSKAEPYRDAFVANQKTKLSDLDQQGKRTRVLQEAAEHFRPEVEKVMQTMGVDISLDAERAANELQGIPVLLPVYVLQIGKKVTIAVNGQTGRVAIGDKKKRDLSKLWIIEPVIFSTIFSVFFGLAFGMPGLMSLMPMMVFLPVFLVGYGDGRGSITRRLIRRSENVRAERIRRELKFTEGRDVLKNPFNNTPVFYEDLYGRKDVPVEIRFYTPLRTLAMMVNMLCLMFLPLVIAIPLRLIAVISNGEGFFEHFSFMGGAVWYMVGIFMGIIYWIRMVRQGIYNRPVFYEIMPDGSKKKVGNSRGVSVFSLFGDLGAAKKDIIALLFTGPGIFLSVFLLIALVMGVLLILEVV